MIGLHPWDILPTQQPDGRDSKKKALEIINAAGSGESIVCDWTHAKTDGMPVDIEMSLNQVLVDDVPTITCVLRDLTERREVEEILKKSEVRFRSLVEHTTDAVFCYEYDPPIPTNLPVCGFK